MKYAILASMMLAFSMPGYASITPGGDEDWCDRHTNPHCHDENGGGETNGTYTNGNTNTNDNTNTNLQGQGQVQGQLQGQLQGQSQVATGGNATAISGSGVFGSGNSENTNTATGGEGGTGVGIGTGGSVGDVMVNVGGIDASGYGNSEGEGAPGGDINSFSPTATTGDSTSSITDNSFDGGNTLIIGGSGRHGEGEGSSTLSPTADSSVEIGDTNNSSNSSASTGDVTQVVEGSSQVVEGSTTDINVDARTINNAPKMPVAGVAPSFSALCNSGAAGQGRDFGLSVSVTNDVCQALMMADAYMAMGNVEEASKWVEAAARHAKWKGGMGYFRHVITLGAL